MGIHGDRVVLKKEGKFLSIPLESVHVEGSELVARDVDWPRAERDGEAWRSNYQDAIAYDDQGMPISKSARA